MKQKLGAEGSGTSAPFWYFIEAQKGQAPLRPDS